MAYLTHNTEQEYHPHNPTSKTKMRFGYFLPENSKMEIGNWLNPILQKQRKNQKITSRQLTNPKQQRAIRITMYTDTHGMGCGMPLPWNPLKAENDSFAADGDISAGFINTFILVVFPIKHLWIFSKFDH